MKLQEAESILMALVAKADDALRDEETHAAERILYRDGDDDAHTHWVDALMHTDEAGAAIAVMAVEPVAKRVQFVADLWEVAISDFEVSRSENDTIFSIAEKLGVPAYPEGAKPLPIAKLSTANPTASPQAKPTPGAEKKQLIPGPFSTPVFLAIAALMLFFFFFFDRIVAALS